VIALNMHADTSDLRKLIVAAPSMHRITCGTVAPSQTTQAWAKNNNGSKKMPPENCQSSLPRGTGVSVPSPARSGCNLRQSKDKEDALWCILAKYGAARAHFLARSEGCSALVASVHAALPGYLSARPSEQQAYVNFMLALALHRTSPTRWCCN
jgi:hypothetical protein